MAVTIQQIIEQADKRTERRAGRELDLTAEFWMALNEFCLEKRFEWRKKTFRFSTIVGKQNYDLSSADSNKIAPDFYEMITLYNVMAGSSPNTGINYSEITPILDQDVMTQALENITPGQPSQYYILPGTTQTLFFNCPANAIYPIRGHYWAVPEPTLDDSTEIVPLVPVQITPLLVVAMERRILAYLLGQEDPRVIQAEARYRRAVALASKMYKFTTNAILQFAMQDGAVRAVDASTSGIDQQIVGRSD